MNYIGSVPEGVAAEEAQRLLDPPVVVARKQYEEMRVCKHQMGNLTPSICVNCGSRIEVIDAQRAYEKESDLRRADGLP